MVLKWHALVLKEHGHHSEALQKLTDALSQAKDAGATGPALATLASDIADLTGATSRSAAIRFLRNEIATQSDGAGRAELCMRLADWHSKASPPEHVAASEALELAALAQPYDEDLRFKIGYAYAQMNAQRMAWWHYSKISSGPGSRNNMGIALDTIDCPIRAVAAFRESERLGNSLAAANLAYRLLDAGFSEEANKLLSAARATETPHRNVSVAIGEIEIRQTKEEHLLEEVAKDVELFQTERAEFGKAALDQTAALSDLSGEYSGSPYSLTLVAPDSREVSGSFMIQSQVPDIVPEQQASLAGQLEGRVLRFTWRLPPLEKGKYELFEARSGHGVLLLSGDWLHGYLAADTAPPVDAKRPTGYKQWHLTRLRASRGDQPAKEPREGKGGKLADG